MESLSLKDKGSSGLYGLSESASRSANTSCSASLERGFEADASRVFKNAGSANGSLAFFFLVSGFY
jgi:hypothetical protein